MPLCHGSIIFYRYSFGLEPFKVNGAPGGRRGGGVDSLHRFPPSELQAGRSVRFQFNEREPSVACEHASTDSLFASSDQSLHGSI
jgi:hypothetical protein